MIHRDQDGRAREVRVLTYRERADSVEESSAENRAENRGVTPPVSCVHGKGGEDL